MLDRLVGFAAGGLPAELMEPEPGEQYSVHCVHDDPAGWTLASVCTDAARCTPPHDHASWGAAATVEGIERNRRYRGTCPDQLVEGDEQLAPVAGGYLLAEADIHQACGATGMGSLSLHLRTTGGPPAQQRCHEPPRHPTTPQSRDEWQGTQARPGGE